jgi:hypothetical protein
MLEVVDGLVEVPSAPGWGVEPAPSFLPDAEYAVSRT